MGMLWVVFFVALTGSHFGYGLPLGPTPQTYPYDGHGSAAPEGWHGGLYAAVPALALLITAVGLLLGCTWCYRHKDCKPNQGEDNQLFAGSVTQHLHDARRSNPPDSGFSEPANNNISEDNNNGPISLREMQNIANNNAAAYIVSENEERNRVSRESVVEFEPLPTGIRVADPLERYADWFGGEDFTRNRLQYLREIGRGWFGRVVEGEVEDGGSSSTVAVKILNQNASLEDKARFLEEARMYRDVSHENILGFIDKCLQEDPWILLFEFCPMDLQQYLIVNRHKMASLNESGVPLQLMCDVSLALAYLHSRGYLYGGVWSGSVLTRGAGAAARAVLGRYAAARPPSDHLPPELMDHPQHHTASSDVWSLGTLVWQVCTWGMTPPHHAPPLPDLPCPYRNHLYQVMQLCWQRQPAARPTCAQVHALLSHLRVTHAARASPGAHDAAHAADFEERWQRLKPNTIPVIDEHRAQVHVHDPSTSATPPHHFTQSDRSEDFDNPPTVQDSLSVDMDTAVSRSSSIMSDKDPLSVQIKSESLTNLHGSLEDVRNIYLTHNEMAVLECHQGNIGLDDREKEHDRSDSSVDPWLKDIIAGSQDDVSYYRDVSDVIKNLDNILNSEKTSSSESSHQASPSRDNLSLDCKKDYPMQSSMVKSPGISNFQNILESGLGAKSPELEACAEDDVDRDTIGTLSHSFERHSDTTSQQTLENITPETPIKDLDMICNIEDQNTSSVIEDQDKSDKVSEIDQDKSLPVNTELPNEHIIVSSDSQIPKLKELCVASIPSVSETNIELSNGTQDCIRSCDNNLAEERTDKEIETKSIDDVVKENAESTPVEKDTVKESDSALECRSQELDDVVLILPKEKPETTNAVLEMSSIRDSEDMIMAERKSAEVNFIISECPKITDKLELKNVNEEIVFSDLILPVETISDSLKNSEKEVNTLKNTVNNDTLATVNNIEVISIAHSEAPESVQNIVHSSEAAQSSSEFVENKLLIPELSETTPLPPMSPETVQTKDIITPTHDEMTFQSKDVSEVEDIASPRLEIEDSTSLQVKEATSVPTLENVDVVSPKFDVENSTSPKLESNAVTLSNLGTENLISYKLEDDSFASPNLEVEKTGSTTLELHSTDLVKEEIKEATSPKHNLEIEETLSPKLGFDTENVVASNSQDEAALLSKLDTEVAASSKLEVQDESSTKLGHKETPTLLNQSNESTAYMDLTTTSSNTTVKDKSVDDEMKELIKSCLDNSNADTHCTIVKNESTIYMDLPSKIKETDSFLQSERIVSRHTDQFKDACSSTPIASDHSTDNTLENSVKANEVDGPRKSVVVKPDETDVLSETKVPEYEPGVVVTKLEQRYVPENMSPFESPTKSHHTDTYDENSSVVLGPFENCTLEIYKGVKSLEPVDLPREELLAFSSNFSEMNLETPSPLRDGNFLNEVPDIIHDDIQFDDLDAVSEHVDGSGAQTEESNETERSATEKRVSPLTPPNSPGNFLASTSQQKYSVVDIDLDPPGGPSTSEVDSGLPKEVDLNQIELQITTKMAMAENENNLNIEYSGPLTVEGVVLDETMVLHESEAGREALEESFLAGNGGESPRAALELDEECVKALRDELELKLPLAQVSNISPAHGSADGSDDGSGGGSGGWGGAELVLSYPGALSPIAEETRQQLTAYENDAHWNASIRTDSSESYPEPCNNSTDEVTDLPTGMPSARDHDTYTLRSQDRGDRDRDDRDHGDRDHDDRDHSPDRTYTLCKDNTSKEVTMSADSLNGSPYKKAASGSPIDDRTYNKNDDEKESGCERISQVSPFILSPTADTSAPESDLADNATRVSTLSKTTAPTDADSSKPSETQCLSKATSIDSWCSNDTLYNVEENFDDLAVDPEPALGPRDDSESTDTLTHDDERELSRCSTYIVHDSRSERGTFSPDSISADDNCTYTKPRADAPDAAATTEPDSTRSQTRDLAYGTLMSGLPSYSNCTTEVASGIDDAWRLQPELVRRSPVPGDLARTPPRPSADKDDVADSSPQLPAPPCLTKMDSVEITCLHDNLVDSPNQSASPDARHHLGEVTESPDSRHQLGEVTESPDVRPHLGEVSESPDSRNLLEEIAESPNSHYKNMAPSVTSTPFTEVPADYDSSEAIPMPLPDDSRTPELSDANLPNFRAFQQSAEVRPQDISCYNDGASTQDTEVLLEGDSQTLSRISARDSLAVADHTPNYSDFENSAMAKPQDVNSRDSRDRSGQSLESGVSSDDFRHFETSVRSRPQDLSTVIDASSLLLNSERKFSDSVTGSSTSRHPEQPSQTESRENNYESMKSLDVSPPNDTNLIESQDVGSVGTPINYYVDNLEMEEETEQPHSIIMTERDVLKDTPNKTFDSHTDGPLVDLNHTYDSHGSRNPLESNENTSHHYRDAVHVNGIDKKNTSDNEKKSPKVDDLLGLTDTKSPKEVRENVTILPAVVREATPGKSDSRAVRDIEIKCNGNSEKYATVQFLSETFEELIESNVDDGDCKDLKPDDCVDEMPIGTEIKSPQSREPISPMKELEGVSQNLVDLEEVEGEVQTNGLQEAEEKLTSVTENFLRNEKKFAQLDSYFPLLSDIRFTGPAAEIMSTSFTQDSPTEPTSPECPRDGKCDAADILKEWDSDSDSHSTNSSSGEFIWKDGDGHETPLVPSTHFQHQRGSGGGGGGQSNGAPGRDAGPADDAGSGLSDGSGDSGSGSEGDEVEFVPSSWDCRAAPAKSSLRSLEATPDSKKRVVFKRQKYHCVYEYPREVATVDASPAAYVPDLSTYSDWDPSSAEEAELGYGQLFGAPSPLDLYPLRAGVAYDYDEDFFISSSARPFESLGIMSTTSQFFPGMYAKAALDRETPDDGLDDFPPPPSPPAAPAPPALPTALAAPPAALAATRTPSLDLTTPDSGVEDVTPGSAADDDFRPDEAAPRARPADVPLGDAAPASPAPASPGEALGGLRHTRDRLKLDLPPSPHAPSPRHARVFSFALDKPRRAPPGDAPPADPPPPPLPLASRALDLPLPEPTFSTFGKSAPRCDAEQRAAIVLTDAARAPPPPPPPAAAPPAPPPPPADPDPGKGEGTVLDSGDEDSGIESSSKATLERTEPAPSVS